jgi:hypothetical protein
MGVELGLFLIQTRMFESKVLRRVFGPKIEGVTKNGEN